MKQQRKAFSAMLRLCNTRNPSLYPSDLQHYVNVPCLQNEMRHRQVKSALSDHSFPHNIILFPAPVSAHSGNFFVSECQPSSLLSCQRQRKRKSNSRPTFKMSIDKVKIPSNQWHLNDVLLHFLIFASAFFFYTIVGSKEIKLHQQDQRVF